MPLDVLNDKEKRAEEGIYEDFNVVQFRKVEGDDASCLNLNRIKQPAVLGVDLAVMGDKAEGLCQPPGRKGIGGKAGMHQPEGADHPLIRNNFV